MTSNLGRDTLRAMFRLRALSLAAAAVVLACGGDDSGGGAGSAATGGSARVSCVVAVTSGGTTINMICEEGTGIYADQIRAACSRPPADAAIAPHADITSNPCPRTNALGACTITTGSGSLTAWYYADGRTTSEQIAMLCAQTGQMFIAP